MTLQERSYQTIELPKILELLAQEAATEPAKQLCRELRPVYSLKLCERLQQETEDAARLIGLQGSPAFSGLRDISAALERAEKGGFLNPVELLGVGAMLRAARLTKNYREERRQTETSLDEYFTLLNGNKFLEEKIENDHLRGRDLRPCQLRALSDPPPDPDGGLQGPGGAEQDHLLPDQPEDPSGFHHHAAQRPLRGASEGGIPQ